MSEYVSETSDLFLFVGTSLTNGHMLTAPYDLAAEDSHPTVQDCAEIALAAHPPVAPTAILGIQESLEPARAARAHKDRTLFDGTGISSGRLDDSRAQERVDGGAQLRQGHDGGVRLAGGPLGATDLDPGVPDDDHQTVVSSVPSTAPPPYQQY